MSKVSTGTRLKQIMNQRGLKQVDILELTKPLQKELNVKIGKTDLSQYVNDKVEPRQDKLYLMARALDVNEAWLMGFDVSQERKQTDPNNITPVTGFQRIPVIGKIACGDPITAIENVTEYREVPKDYLNYNGELFFLEASGDSMEPKIPDGSYVLCRKQEDVESGEIAAVLVNGDEETTLKKVIKQGKTILLQPLNEDYAPYIVTEDNPAKIVGKALRVDTEL